MSDRLKLDNVELLTDEFSEDALAHAGGRGQSRGRTLIRVLAGVALVACGAVAYPLATHFGLMDRIAGAEPPPVVVGLHEAGKEHKPVTVLSGGSQKVASADQVAIPQQKSTAALDGDEQLVPRGSQSSSNEATAVKFDRLAANYKPRSNSAGVQVEQAGAATTGNAPKLDGSSGGVKIAVPISQGRLLRFDDEVESVFIADPSIADVKVLSTNEIYVFGKKAGITSLQAISGNKRGSGDGGLSASVQLYIGYDPEAVVDAKEAVAKSAPLSFNYQGERVVVRGHARNVDEAVAGHETAANYSNGRAPVDIATMDGPNQVNLRVRFVEINRAQMQSFGIDWGVGVNAGSFSLGVSKTSFIGGGLTPNVSGSAKTGNFNINLAIEALQSHGMVNVLAEPNLTAVTGETASFLAGGEVPIPVVSGTAVTNSSSTLGGTSTIQIPQMSVMYKTFGVSLQFTPTMIRKDRIALRVRPEVSSIAGTTTFGVNGVSMPSFTVRRTDTVVEVASGQTFAIAGLFQRDVSRDVEKFPLLGDLPVLGALFQSERFKRNETELVILITPYLVEPISDKPLATPTDKRPELNIAPRGARADAKPTPKTDPNQSGFTYK